MSVKSLRARRSFACGSPVLVVVDLRLRREMSFPYSFKWNYINPAGIDRLLTASFSLIWIAAPWMVAQIMVARVAPSCRFCSRVANRRCGSICDASAQSSTRCEVSVDTAGESNYRQSMSDIMRFDADTRNFIFSLAKFWIQQLFALNRSVQIHTLSWVGRRWVHAIKHCKCSKQFDLIVTVGCQLW